MLDKTVHERLNSTLMMCKKNLSSVVRKRPLSHLQECPTRWGSSTACLDRTHVMKSHDASALSTAGKTELMPSDQDYKVMAKIVKAVQPICSASELIGGSLHPTLSIALDVVRRLKADLEDMRNNLREKKDKASAIVADAVGRPLKELAHRSAQFDCDAARCAGFLNPGLKKTVMKSEDWDGFRQMLLSEMRLTRMDRRADEECKRASAAADAITPHQPDVTHDDLGISDEEEENDTKDKTSGDSHRRNATMTLDELHQMDEVEAEKELQSCLACPVDTKLGVLKWWATTEKAFPSLSVLAKAHLGIPATSVESERTFSLAGEATSKRRSSLTPENAAMIVRLNLLQRCSPSDFDLVFKRARELHAKAQKRGKALGGSNGKR